MIKIKGHDIPPIVISTILGHSGHGLFPLTLLPAYRELMRVVRETGATILTKSSTCEKHAGNFRLTYPWTWKYIQRRGGDGLLNASGLTNRGVIVNAQKIAAACDKGYRVIPNFYPRFAEGQKQAIRETIEAIIIYRYFLGLSFWALELNFSCPNAKEEIRKNMQDALACVAAIKSHHPHLCLIAKISYVHPHEFAQELIDAGVNIIHAVNTIPYDLVYPNGSRSPLATVGGGGVSGGPAFDRALAYNRGLRQRIPDVPMIMGGGVMSLYNVDRYFDLGADAVSICTVCRLAPREAVRIIKESAA